MGQRQGNFDSLFLKYAISKKGILKRAKVFLLSVLQKVGSHEWL
jgi:hypothetical protein